MTKLSTPNKLLLGFGVFFVLEFIGLKLVSYWHLTDQAKLDGENIFNWSWPSKNLRSVAQIYDTKIIKQNGNDAIVKVFAKEHTDDIVGPINVGAGLVSAHPETNCSALLTYCRTNNRWILGKVQFE